MIDIDDLMRVKDRLEELREQIEKILTLSDRNTLGFNIDKARGLFGKFRDHVRVEYVRTSKGNAAISHAEETWYRWAVQDIWAKALVSSIRPEAPLEELRGGLEDAKSSLCGHLSNLKSAIASASPDGPMMDQNTDSG